MKKGEDFTGVTIVFFCHDGAGNYLMAKRTANSRDEYGKWDPGGGALEFNDTVENTLHEEIKEEYGTDVISYEFMGYRDVHREHDGKPTHWIALDFKVLVDPKQAFNAEPHKHEAIGWFKLDALPDPVHSQLVGTIQKYRDRL